MKNIVVLGSTGSIGTQTLDVVRHMPETLHISVLAAGGFIVQLLPFAPESVIEKLEDNIFWMDQLTTILHEDGPEEVIAQVLKGFDYHIVERVPMEYRCYCSRERVSAALASLTPEDLAEIRADGKPVEVTCQFCDAVYTFPVEELEALGREEE